MLLLVAALSAGEQFTEAGLFLSVSCGFSSNRYQMWPFLTQGGLHLLKVKLKQKKVVCCVLMRVLSKILQLLFCFLLI